MVTGFKTLSIIVSSLMHVIYYYPVTANLFESLGQYLYIKKQFFDALLGHIPQLE